MNRPFLGQPGLLVVGREQESEVVPWRQPALASFHASSRVRYRGIDGNPWPAPGVPKGVPIDSGVVPLEYYEQILNYFRSARELIDCDMIYVGYPPAHGEAQPTKIRDLRFCGYDYGYYLWEYSYYSVILNEIVFGLDESMRAYARALNDSVLLGSLNTAAELAATRAHLLAQGVDLEDGEKECGSIAIYSLKDE